MILLPRDIFSDQNDGINNCDPDIDSRCHSSWHSWARWVVAASLIIGFFLLLAGFALATSRRRRNRGLQPYYGTAWLAPNRPYPPQQYGQTGGYPGGYPPGQYPPGQYPPGQGPNEHYTAPYYASTPAPPYSPPQDGAYVPPPGPPPRKEAGDFEMQPMQGAGYDGGHGDHGQQSNNPFYSPPPPVHMVDHATKPQ